MSLKVMSPILSVMSNVITSEVTISEVIIGTVVLSYNRLECLSPANLSNLYYKMNQSIFGLSNLSKVRSLPEWRPLRPHN